MCDSTSTTTSTVIAPVIDPVQARLLQPTWLGQWREFLAYIVSIVILFDFVVAPALVIVFNGTYMRALPSWVPLTTSGGGMFYIAVAAILGISSWGKMTEQKSLIENMPDHS